MIDKREERDRRRNARRAMTAECAAIMQRHIKGELTLAEAESGFHEAAQRALVAMGLDP